MKHMVSRIAAKALVVTGLAAAGSVGVTSVTFGVYGLPMDGIVYFLCVLCPVVTAFPSAAFCFWQSERLAEAHTRMAQMHAKLLETSRLDGLTGVLTREAFFTRLTERLATPRQGALLMVDLDHFKTINDTFGHAAGDEALRRSARALSVLMGAGDLLGRVGGEEFAIFLSESDEERATSLAAAAATALRQVVLPDAPKIRITASIGIAIHAAEDADLLYRKADRRLYRAKGQGRDRFVTADTLAA